MVELVVVVAIVAILTAIALPNFRSSMRSGRVTTGTNDLLTAFNLARNEAITRTRGVSLCAANTTTGTPTACGAVTDWAKGWVVFVDDTAGTTAPTSITAANILRTWVAPTNMSIVPAPATQTYFSFSPRGNYVIAGNISPPTTTLTVKSTDGCSAQQKTMISVAPLGRATSARQNCP